jgi:pentose-5-phosphate-3-epimerase
MKKYLVLAALTLFPFFLQAQNKAITQIFEKYSGKEGFSSIVITKNMFQLFANVDNPENDEFLKTVKNLDFIKILTTEEGVDGKAFYKEVLSAVPEKDYKELMVIQESDQQVKFLTLEKDGVIRELLMVVGGTSESSLVWMSGIIDMKTVSKIAQGMNIEGMDQLDKTGKKE